MEPVLRGLFIYCFLLVVFRLAGKRTLAQTTSFDLVLLLIISETTQQAMVGDDRSITNAVLLILTLVGAAIGLSLLKCRFPALDKWLDGTPVLIIEEGRKHTERMARERIDDEDILEAARGQCGLERLDQIKYAVIERGGKITVVPKRAETPAKPRPQTKRRTPASSRRNPAARRKPRGAPDSDANE